LVSIIFWVGEELVEVGECSDVEEEVWKKNFLELFEIKNVFWLEL